MRRCSPLSSFLFVVGLPIASLFVAASCSHVATTNRIFSSSISSFTVSCKFLAGGFPIVSLFSTASCSYLIAAFYRLLASRLPIASLFGTASYGHLAAGVENLTNKEHQLDEQISKMQERLRGLSEDENTQR
ncbi:hypothetical protein S83_046601 [Arachis hypogaea]